MAMGCTLLAAETGTVYHQFARLQSMSQWWHWLLLVAVCLGLLSLISWLYIRDTRELPRATRWSLLLLRVLALLGVLVFFLDLEKRTERQVVQNSRVLMLIDTSRSMGLSDHEASSGPAGPSRLEQVVQELAQGPFLERLRANHDVAVYRFDEGDKPEQLAMLPKLAAMDDPASDESTLERETRWFAQSRTLAQVALGVLLAAVICGLVFFWLTRRGVHAETRAWPQLAAMVLLIVGLVLLAVADLRSPQANLLAVLGLEQPTFSDESETAPQDALPEATAVASVDWDESLVPRGNETRIGDALRFLVNKERGGPVAGIVLISDGRSNAGIEYPAAVAVAQDAGIPVYTVGLGSDRRPVNVRVVDVEAPQRVYPGDRFTLTGYLQAHGLAGRTVDVQLVSTEGETADASDQHIEEERSVTLGEDAEVMPLRFEILPGGQGSRVYTLRVTPPPQDHDQADDQRTTKVEVMDRKNRVLLLAGGPSREYRFLRTLLYRNRDTTLDVYLQSAEPGVAQEAQNILFSMPEDAESLFQYDCIVAFDPDWQALSEKSIELLDRWVAEKAGGLVVVAGPVHTPTWSRVPRGSDRRIDLLKGLYPVTFYSRGSATLSLGRTGSETAWRLDFTRDGKEAEFLWLEEDGLQSEQVWATFPGVYGYYAVQDVKPGARVYSRFSDPTTAVKDELPVYMAGHFYGAGRVFFQASGEMWRLRALDPVYFERFYTKLIRWASQGRLLQDSSRGLLLVDKERCLLGENVVVRAMLTDAQHNPLVQEEVTAMLVRPDSRRDTLKLRRVQESAQAGMYAGQFTALQEGQYRVEVQVPESAEEVLTREVRVRLPAREIEQPERHDALLREIADKTGAVYYVGMPAATGRQSGGQPPLANALEPQDQVTYLPGTPDRDFEEQLMTWLMGLIAGALCLEWLIRRLHRLA